MTRVFLVAGVAALAIAAPANAGPHAAKEDRVTTAKQSGGQRAQAIERRGGMATQRVQRVERTAMPRAERAQRFALAQRPQRETRTERAATRPARTERVQTRLADRQQVRANRVEQAQTRTAERQQVRQSRIEQVQNRVVERQQIRADRLQQVQNRIVDRRQVRGADVGQGYGVGGCPPGLAKKAVACMPPGQAAKLGLTPVVTAANAARFRAARVDALNRSLGTRILAPATAAMLIGTPLNQAMGLAPLSPLPGAVSYLYPDTPDYYYRYGDGYLYQVDRGSNLIAALLPLLAGGYMPGQYLPTSYMNSYVPNYYGFNSFYQDSPYQCNRYMNGVIYQVDCVTGMVEDVIPMYAGGYGVGQMLPSAYSTYNVPYQYRSLYYDTPDYNYWYAPGAIYQYDQSSSLITSVAALLSPGFAVGQPLPIGYSSYNVPYDYRATYYDTPDAWYRYNNGYIYQVDPTTQLVSAIVASILT